MKTIYFLIAGILLLPQLAIGQMVQRGSDLNGEAAQDRFGESVSISDDGNVVAIGAPFHDGDRGHVRVYSFNGTSWEQLGEDIDGQLAGDQSGYAVSLSSDGNILAVGAPSRNSDTAPGHVRVYSFNGTSWEQQGNDINGEGLGDESGYAVSLSSDGNRIAIGAPEKRRYWQ